MITTSATEGSASHNVVQKLKLLNTLSVEVHGHLIPLRIVKLFASALAPLRSHDKITFRCRSGGEISASHIVSVNSTEPPDDTGPSRSSET